MELGLTHRAFEAEQETIIVVARVINALFINDERVCEGTDLQEVVPVAARTRQAGDFQTEHGSAVLEPDFCYQGLKAITANAGGARMGLILVNDSNPLLRPS